MLFSTAVSSHRHQASVIREGDEGLARGTLDKTGNCPCLCGADETPLVITARDLENQIDRLQSKVGTYELIGAVVLYTLLCRRHWIGLLKTTTQDRNIYTPPMVTAKYHRDGRPNR